MNRDMLKQAEKRTGVDMRSISKLASKYDGKNLHDEKTVRGLVQQVGKIAGKRVPKETEDMIVSMLVNGKGKINEATIKKMLG